MYFWTWPEIKCRQLCHASITTPQFHHQLLSLFSLSVCPRPLTVSLTIHQDKQNCYVTFETPSLSGRLSANPVCIFRITANVRALIRRLHHRCVTSSRDRQQLNRYLCAWKSLDKFKEAQISTLKVHDTHSPTSVVFQKKKLLKYWGWEVTTFNR